MVLLVPGEVPNLFPKDELAGVLDEVRPAAKKENAGETAEALYAFFLERVRTNLHVILCLSPIGEAFRERCRMFPGQLSFTCLLSLGCTTPQQDRFSNVWRHCVRAVLWLPEVITSCLFFVWHCAALALQTWLLY